MALVECTWLRCNRPGDEHCWVATYGPAECFFCGLPIVRLTSAPEACEAQPMSTPIASKEHAMPAATKRPAPDSWYAERQSYELLNGPGSCALRDIMGCESYTTDMDRIAALARSCRAFLALSENARELGATAAAERHAAAAQLLAAKIKELA